MQLQIMMQHIEQEKNAYNKIILCLHAIQDYKCSRQAIDHAEWELIYSCTIISHPHAHP